MRKRLILSAVLLAAVGGMARAADVDVTLSLPVDYAGKGMRVLWQVTSVPAGQSEGLAMDRPTAAPLQANLAEGSWDVVGFAENATFMARIEVKAGTPSYVIGFDHAPRECEKLSNRITGFTFSGQDAAGNDLPMPCAAISGKDEGFAAAQAEVVPTYGLIQSIVDGGGAICDRPLACNVEALDPGISFDLPPMWMAEKPQPVVVEGKGEAALVFFWRSFGNFDADPAYVAVLNPVDEEFAAEDCDAVSAGSLCKAADFSPDLQEGFDALAKSFSLP